VKLSNVKAGTLKPIAGPFILFKMNKTCREYALNNDPSLECKVLGLKFNKNNKKRRAIFWIEMERGGI